MSIEKQQSSDGENNYDVRGKKLNLPAKVPLLKPLKGQSMERLKRDQVAFFDKYLVNDYIVRGKKGRP